MLHEQMRVRGLGARPAGPTFLGGGFGLLEGSSSLFPFTGVWVFQARKGRKRMEEERRDI